MDEDQSPRRKGKATHRQSTKRKSRAQVLSDEEEDELVDEDEAADEYDDADGDEDADEDEDGDEDDAPQQGTSGHTTRSCADRKTEDPTKPPVVTEARRKEWEARSDPKCDRCVRKKWPCSPRQRSLRGCYECWAVHRSCEINGKKIAKIKPEDDDGRNAGEESPARQRRRGKAVKKPKAKRNTNARRTTGAVGLEQVKDATAKTLQANMFSSTTTTIERLTETMGGLSLSVTGLEHAMQREATSWRTLARVLGDVYAHDGLSAAGPSSNRGREMRRLPRRASGSTARVHGTMDIDE